MSRFFFTLAFTALLSASAYGEEAAATAETKPTEALSPAAGTADTNHIATPSAAAPMPPATSEGTAIVDKYTAPAAKEDTGPITAALNDGTQVIFFNDGTVKVKIAGGKELTPPDGVLTLRDGTTFAVKDGKRIE